MAEELNLEHFDLGTFVDYVHALKQERDALRAQLPSQGGEAVEVVGAVILGGIFHGGSGPELGDIDVELNPDVLERIQAEVVHSADDVMLSLMTVAQHQRILADTVPAGCKVVPVELLELIDEAMCDFLGEDDPLREQLRAILEMKDE